MRTSLIPLAGFCAVLLLSAALPALAAAEAPILWYGAPSVKWTDALPVGNGRVGAMIFGGVSSEHLQFNEDTLWTGKPHDYAHPGAAEHLPELRALVNEGKFAAAATLAKATFIGVPGRQEAYQPFGDLHFAVEGSGPVQHYRRELDLSRGVARVIYTQNGVTYTRETFVSYPDQVLVTRFSADKPGSVSLHATMDSPHPGSVTTVRGDRLVLSGAVSADGIRFESDLKAVAIAGTAKTSGSSIDIQGADSVTFLLTAATSFRTYLDISANPQERSEGLMARAESKSYGQLLAAHEADYTKLFGRVSLQLGSTSRVDLPTDLRLAKVKAEGLAGDNALAALYFQYGRYLLISSSRDGGQPANLQGIWNNLMDPPWESKWTTNINLEMNYWPAEVTNLSECTGPLFDLIDDLRVSGHQTAEVQYHARGWVLHHNTDLWRGTAPVNGIDGVWPTGGAWLCQHLWEHYLFTGDKAFLKERAYPAMKEACLFFMDDMVRDAKTGWLVTNPSYSPEQGTLTAGPTMDNQLVRALVEHTLAAAMLLDIDTAWAEELRQFEAQLAPNQVGRYGQLQEWLTDIDKPKNNHRHMSPLWALFPGADITPADPKVYAAAKTLLDWRGPGSTGWSFAWRINLWARVDDGEYAYKQLNGLFQRRTLSNLFDLCGPFQIDGNFGATAGIAEMLVQSHETLPRSDEPIIEILPALPQAWGSGSVTGLKLRGNFEADIAWNNGKLTHLVVRSAAGNPCQIRYDGHTFDFAGPAGSTVTLDYDLKEKS